MTRLSKWSTRLSNIMWGVRSEFTLRYKNYAIHKELTLYTFPSFAFLWYRTNMDGSPDGNQLRRPWAPATPKDSQVRCLSLKNAVNGKENDWYFEPPAHLYTVRNITSAIYCYCMSIFYEKVVPTYFPDRFSQCMPLSKRMYYFSFSF